MREAAAHPNAQRRALLALLAGGVAIGCSPLFVRFSEVGPVGTAFWRVALALLPLVIFSRLRPSRGTGAPRSPGDYAMVMLPGVFLAADLIAWHIALHHTTVANATLISNLAPIFVTLFNWLFLSQRISRRFLLGLSVTTVGTLSLVGGPSALASGHIAGDGIALLAGIVYAGYILTVGWVRQRFSTSSLMIWSTASAALSTLPFALAFEGSLLPLTMAGWLILIGLAWVSQVGGQGCIAFALAALPTSFSSLTLLIQPIVAAILAWLLLGEALTGYQFAGGAMILTGILIARRG